MSSVHEAMLMKPMLIKPMLWYIAVGAAGWIVSAAARCGYRGTGASVPALLDRWFWRLTVLYIGGRLVTIAFGT